MSRLKAFLDVAKQHLDKIRGTDRRKVKKLKAKVKSLRAEIRDWDKAQEENLELLTVRAKQIEELHAAFGDIKDYLGVSHSISLWDSVQAIKNICAANFADTNSLIQTLKKENEEKRKNILAIREAADIQVTVGDGLIATCIRDKMGEIATLNAALKHANVEFTKVWAHREKGGRYRNLGEVIQAGTFADKSENKEYVAYQCLESGKIYLSEGEDFDNTMWIIENLE